MRRNKSLRRKAALRRRATQMKRESSKRQAANRERSTVLAKLREESDGICPICRNEQAIDGHELLRRSAAGSITDSANIRLIGRRCHEWITSTVDGQRWAREHGWSKSRFEVRDDRTV